MFLNQEPLRLGITAFNDSAIKDRTHLFLFPSKFEMPTARNAVRIPQSLSVLHRPELVKKEDLRGEIGLSFNPDALFANSK